MKKVIVILMLVTGCTTTPVPKITVNSPEITTPGRFVIESDGGYISCYSIVTQKQEIMAFEGTVVFEGEWIIFVPKNSRIKAIVTKGLCEVLITDYFEVKKVPKQSSTEGTI